MSKIKTSNFKESKTGENTEPRTDLRGSILCEPNCSPTLPFELALG